MLGWMDGRPSPLPHILDPPLNGVYEENKTCIATDSVQLYGLQCASFILFNISMPSKAVVVVQLTQVIGIRRYSILVGWSR